MKRRRIILTVYDDVSDRDALYYASELVRLTRDPNDVGKAPGGIRMAYGKCDKQLSIMIWQHKELTTNNE